MASGDLPAALTAYEYALAAGMAGPAVHYNIGVVAYRLDDLDRAEAAFRAVAMTPAMAPLAHYNLGLVALARGDPATAGRWFEIAAATTDDPALRALAAARLPATGAPRLRRRWSGYAAAGVGYDDNVALLGDATLIGATGLSDSFAELLLAAAVPAGQYWRMDGALAWVDYQDLDRYDQLSLAGSFGYARPASDWRIDLRLEGGYSTLDGDRFETRYGLGVYADRTLRPGRWLRTRYRFTEVNAAGIYDGLSGSRHLVVAGLLSRAGPMDLFLFGEAEFTDHRDPVLTWTGYRLGADLRRALTPRWTVELGAGWRRRDYDGGEAGRRNEDWLQGVVAVGWRFGRAWRLVARYQYTDNSADLAVYDYTSHRVTASLEWSH